MTDILEWASIYTTPTRPLVFLWRLLAVLVTMAAICPNSEASETEAAGSVLKKVQAGIAANRSAAKSVLIRGRIHEVGRLVQSKGKLEREPYVRDAQFEFLADDFGARKRWTKSYNDLEWNRLRQNIALTESAVLDASNPTFGYLRPAKGFEHEAGYDFYRDHWLGDEALSFLLNDKSRGAWAVRGVPPESMTLEYKLKLDDGTQEHLFLTVNPERDYLVTKSIGYSQLTQADLNWSKDAASGIWYQSAIRSRQRVILPSRSSWEEEQELTITEVRFNEAVPAENFTFAGLGLQRGSPVADQRGQPTLELVYWPSNRDVDSLTLGLVAPSVAQELQKQETTRSRLLIGLAVAAALAVAGVGAGYVYQRRRQRKAHA